MNVRGNSNYLTVCATLLLCSCGQGSSSGGPTTETKALGGTLSIANAPTSIGGKFNAGIKAVRQSNSILPNFIGLQWIESGTLDNLSHMEILDIVGDAAKGKFAISYTSGNMQNQMGEGYWFCDDNLPGNSTCSGVRVDLTAKTVTFENQVMTVSTNNTALNINPVTLNGTLQFDEK